MRSVSVPEKWKDKRRKYITVIAIGLAGFIFGLTGPVSIEWPGRSVQPSQVQLMDENGAVYYLDRVYFDTSKRYSINTIDEWNTWINRSQGQIVMCTNKNTNE